jgi:hypothetical protein
VTRARRLPLLPQPSEGATRGEGKSNYCACAACLAGGPEGIGLLRYGLGARADSVTACINPRGVRFKIEPGGKVAGANIEAPEARVADWSYFCRALSKRLLYLTIIGRARDEACAMLVLACFPDDRDLIYRDITRILLLVLQMQHAAFDLRYLTAQTRRAAAKDVDLTTDHS